jgi:hypothetical protein
MEDPKCLTMDDVEYTIFRCDLSGESGESSRCGLVRVYLMLQFRKIG